MQMQMQMQMQIQIQIQIQINFIPGQRAKLQLVGQIIQCSECELHIQRKWKYKQIIINTQLLERASVPQCSYYFLPIFCVVFKIWFDNIISPNYLAKYISSRLTDYWWIVMDCRQPPLRSDWPSKKSAATAFQKLWRNILKIFLPWLSSSQEERTFLIEPLRWWSRVLYFCVFEILHLNCGFLLHLD